MSGDQLIGRAVVPTTDVVRHLTPDQLSAPTPCDGYDVRALVNHLLFWGPSLEGAAGKLSVPPPAAGEADVDLAAGDWATMVGDMVLTELVVHGWDLARATGQRPVWDGAVLAHVHDAVVATAEMGRDLGIYGPEVPVADDAPVLDRILGLTGRDPGAVPDQAR